MSLDSDSAAAASTSRDWYFPSPPFIHNNSNSTKFPKYRRRFPTNPRPSQHLPPDSRPPFGGVSSPNSSPPFRSVSSSTSAPHRAFNHDRLRRRVDFGRRREKPQRNDVNEAIPSVSDGVSRRRSEISSAVSGEKFLGFLGNGFNVRWKMAFFVAVLSLPNWYMYIHIHLWFWSQIFFFVHLADCDDSIFISGVPEFLFTYPSQWVAGIVLLLAMLTVFIY